MYITNNLNIALIAQKYGVDRIWIDLETKNKEERQKGRNSVKSHHKISDIGKIKPLLTTSEMLVRINPWDNESKNEIESVIEAGADIIMLPMWHTADEVKRFVSAIDGRCKTMLLLETKEADECLDEVLGIPGIDEIHIGLNDLHISYGLTFMFELLTNGTVERICKKVRNYGIPYGFGGIAKIGSGDIAAEKILLEHYRLGSTCVILSRSFCDCTKINDISQIDQIFSQNIGKLRLYEKQIIEVPPNIFEKNRQELKQDVEHFIQMHNQQKIS